MSHSVYRFTNTRNGKSYIGYSNNVDRRYREHLLDAKNGSTLPFHRALKKYGIRAFEFEILAEGLADATLAAQEEERLIVAYKTNETGYNCNTGGITCVGAKGESNGATKLKEEQAIAIIQDPRSHREVAKEYDVHETTVSDIRKGKSWKHLDRSTAPSYTDPRKKINEEIAQAIVDDPRSLRVVSKSFGINKTTVLEIRQGKYWKNLDRANAPTYERERK